jgi:hypothetical protein
MSDGDLSRDLNLALDPGRLLRAVGMTPDSWQEEVLRERPKRALMLCCRQAGKTLTAAAAALHEALYREGALVLIIAPTQRQSAELLRRSRFLLTGLRPAVAISAESTYLLELANGSRIISLPATEDTIRGYSSVSLLIIDEAARVPDELYYTLRPMLVVSNGRLLGLTTPAGQRGWFYEAWVSDQPWTRIKIIAEECPRIAAAVLAEERETMTAEMFASEWECEFGDTIDSVFSHADVTAALDPSLSALYEGGLVMTQQRYVVGLDLGQANDPTAVAIVEHDYIDPQPTYRIRALHRYPLGTRYPAIVNDVTARLLAPPLKHASLLAIDGTGVGRPIVDLFKDNPELQDIYGITITGGGSPTGNGYRLSVPKHELISTSTILFQQHRIRISTDLPDTPTLIGELLNYRIRTTDSGHQRYEPASTTEHDDLLLALSLALWTAQRRPARIPMKTYVTTGRIPTPEDRFLPRWL